MYRKRKRLPRTPRPNILEDVEEDDGLTLEESFQEPGRPARSRVRSSATNNINEKHKRDFLGQLGTKPRGTFVPIWLLKILPNSTDAIVFAQLLYWFLNNSGHKPWPDRQIPFTWIAKSTPELAEEIGRTKDETNHAMTRLQKIGFVDWKIRKFGGVNHRHVWINWQQVKIAHQQVTEGGVDRAHA